MGNMRRRRLNDTTSGLRGPDLPPHTLRRIVRNADMDRGQKCEKIACPNDELSQFTCCKGT